MPLHFQTEFRNQFSRNTDQADISDGISAVSNDGTLQPVYRMDGSRVNARNLRNLPAGAYIIGGKKVIKK